jgi:serine/threonine-protein kinase
MRLIAVDDDAGMARVLERCLKGWGYDAVVLRDSQAAWQILKHDDSPRVVVLDWDMPGLSGMDLCRMVRATPHGGELYVLMLTARQGHADLIEALESGADDFLAKPFDLRELQLRLAKGVREVSRHATADSAKRDREASAGRTLGGKFRLEKKIAAGGMGSIWRGVHLALGVNVAIKFMAPELAETAAYASFEREARAAAQLRSEHAVRVYDHGIDHAGCPYLAMEYLGGESLAAHIDSKGALALDAVAELVAQTAHALTEAHARGIIHRDIKPENIFLVDEHERAHGYAVKVIDFGLANLGGVVWDENGTIAGTPHYLSPEYLRGGTAPDAFIDLWALAVTAFVAATGCLPFDGTGIEEIFHNVTAAPLPVPSSVNAALPRAFDAWFALACARDREVRFQTAAELSAALSAACFVSGEAAPAPRRPSAVTFAVTERDVAPPSSMEKPPTLSS